MINWFGMSSWDAPICRNCPRCDAPVGVACARCGRAIVATDSGVTMPGSSGPVAYHLTCHLKMIVNHWQWPSFGLVPDDFDGLKDGEWRCAHCGMSYSVASGWRM